MRSVLLFLLVIAVFAVFLSMRHQSVHSVEDALPVQTAQQPQETTPSTPTSPREQHAAVNVRQITDMPEPEVMWKQKTKQMHLDASDGSVFAQRELGLYYVHGDENEKDYKKGYYWFGRAAEQGDPLSLVYMVRYHLGDFSFAGFTPSLAVAYGILEGIDETAHPEIIALKERVQEHMQPKEND